MVYFLRNGNTWQSQHFPHELAEKKYIASFNRVKKMTLSERARQKKRPSLLPVENNPVKKGLQMQVQARRDIAVMKEQMRSEQIRVSDASSMRTGDSGGLRRLR